jgi:hypothetical protein
MSKEFECKEIREAIKNISVLLNDGLENLDAEALEVVKQRHSLLLEQYFFWVLQDNNARCIKDLYEYANWLCDFIAEEELKYWGNKE